MEILEYNFGQPLEHNKLTYHFKNKHDEQAWMTPVEKVRTREFFWKPGSLTSLDDTSGKVKICEPIWDIFLKNFFNPF